MNFAKACPAGFRRNGFNTQNTPGPASAGGPTGPSGPLRGARYCLSPSGGGPMPFPRSEEAPKYGWLRAICSPFGPHPVIRHILMVLAMHMAKDGSRCFPGVRLISKGKMKRGRRRIQTKAGANSGREAVPEGLERYTFGEDHHE